MRAWVLSAVAVLLALGVLVPRTAARAAHALTLTVAMIVVVYLVMPVFDSIFVHVRARPFSTAETPAASGPLPPELVEINRALSDADAAIPAPIVRRVQVIAAGKLFDHHRLSLERPDDRPAIRALVSPTLWHLIEPAGSTPTSFDRTAVPVLAMRPLLDELEAL